ncbi:histone deacetylase 14, partial [Quercus suber]
MTTVLDEIIVPCAQRFKIKADIILVSAGSRGEHATRRCLILNNLPKIYSGDDSLSYLVADSFSAFLGEQSLVSKYDNPPILFETPLAKVKQ